MIGIFLNIKLLVAADVLVLLVKQATGITIVQPATSSSWIHVNDATSEYTAVEHVTLTNDSSDLLPQHTAS